jgi:hypothetical protein
MTIDLELLDDVEAERHAFLRLVMAELDQLSHLHGFTCKCGRGKLNTKERCMTCQRKVDGQWIANHEKKVKP